MSRKVIQAKLHDLKLVVGGVAMPTEYPSQNKSIPDLEMTYDGANLEITAFGKFFAIPSANVQMVQYASGEKTQVKK